MKYKIIPFMEVSVDVVSKLAFLIVDPISQPLHPFVTLIECPGL